MFLLLLVSLALSFADADLQMKRQDLDVHIKCSNFQYGAGHGDEIVQQLNQDRSNCIETCHQLQKEDHSYNGANMDVLTSECWCIKNMWGRDLHADQTNIASCRLFPLETNPIRCQEVNMDYQGTPVYTESSIDDCMQRCRSDSTCKAWTFYPDSYPNKPSTNCHLQFSDVPATTVNGLISGKRDCDVTEAFNCKGEDNNCCTETNPCQLHDGDCDNDNQCSGDLVCGVNNCIWGGDDDCCKKAEVPLPVYESDLTDTCNDNYVKEGCYDTKRHMQRGALLVYWRSDITWSSIEFRKFAKQLVCKCAEEALAKGIEYFGVHYWGECFSLDGYHFNEKKDGWNCILADGLFKTRCSYDAEKENSLPCIGASHYYIYKTITIA